MCLKLELLHPPFILTTQPDNDAAGNSVPIIDSLPPYNRQT